MLTIAFYAIPADLEALLGRLTNVACFKQIYFFLKIILSTLLKWFLPQTCGIPMVCVTHSILTLCPLEADVRQISLSKWRSLY